jgi:hypothetical protein
MARQLDPRLQEILQQYHPNPKAAVWDCHGVWVIYHKAVELIAAKAGVKFSEPKTIESNAEKKIAVLSVTGTLGDHSEWSIGEATPYNNKNSYPYAMAEKRAKDRVVLKLVGLHGDVYSEEEADDFSSKASASNDDDIAEIEEMSHAKRDDLHLQMDEINDLDTLNLWGKHNAEAISKLTDADQREVRTNYKNRVRFLKMKVAAA